MYLSDNKVSVGIYDWPKMLKDKGLPIKKDINANQITYVDEKYLITYSELSLKDDTEFVKIKRQTVQLIHKICCLSSL